MSSYSSDSLRSSRSSCSSNNSSDFNFSDDSYRGPQRRSRRSYENNHDTLGVSSPLFYLLLILIVGCVFIVIIFKSTIGVFTGAFLGMRSSNPGRKSVEGAGVTFGSDEEDDEVEELNEKLDDVSFGQVVNNKYMPNFNNSQVQFELGRLRTPNQPQASVRVNESDDRVERHDSEDNEDEEESDRAKSGRLRSLDSESDREKGSGRYSGLGSNNSSGMNRFFGGFGNKAGIEFRSGSGLGGGSGNFIGNRGGYDGPESLRVSGFLHPSSQISNVPSIAFTPAPWNCSNGPSSGVGDGGYPGNVDGSNKFDTLTFGPRDYPVNKSDNDPVTSEEVHLAMTRIVRLIRIIDLELVQLSELEYPRYGSINFATKQYTDDLMRYNNQLQNLGKRVDPVIGAWTRKMNRTEYETFCAELVSIIEQKKISYNQYVSAIGPYSVSTTVNAAPTDIKQALIYMRAARIEVTKVNIRVEPWKKYLRSLDWSNSRSLPETKHFELIQRDHQGVHSATAETIFWFPLQQRFAEKHSLYKSNEAAARLYNTCEDKYSTNVLAKSLGIPVIETRKVTRHHLKKFIGVNLHSRAQNLGGFFELVNFWPKSNGIVLKPTDGCLGSGVLVIEWTTSLDQVAVSSPFKGQQEEFNKIWTQKHYNLSDYTYNSQDARDFWANLYNWVSDSTNENWLVQERCASNVESDNTPFEVRVIVIGGKAALSVFRPASHIGTNKLAQAPKAWRRDPNIENSWEYTWAESEEAHYAKHIQWEIINILNVFTPHLARHAENLAQNLGARLMFRADFFIEPVKPSTLSQWSVTDDHFLFESHLNYKLNEIQHWWGGMWHSLDSGADHELAAYTRGYSLTNKLFIQELAKIMTDLWSENVRLTQPGQPLLAQQRSLGYSAKVQMIKVSDEWKNKKPLGPQSESRNILMRFRTTSAFHGCELKTDDELKYFQAEFIQEKKLMTLGMVQNTPQTFTKFKITRHLRRECVGEELYALSECMGVAAFDIL